MSSGSRGVISDQSLLFSYINNPVCTHIFRDSHFKRPRCSQMRILSRIAPPRKSEIKRKHEFYPGHSKKVISDLSRIGFSPEEYAFSHMCENGIFFVFWLVGWVPFGVKMGPIWGAKSKENSKTGMNWTGVDGTGVDWSGMSWMK
jgi:hypothetical protein